MKTKTFFTELLLTALLMIAFFSCPKSDISNLLSMLMIAFFSCKNSRVSNKNQNNKPGALNETGGNTTWDSPDGNIVASVFSPNTITGSITLPYSSTFVYSIGEVISSGIPSASTYKNCSVYKHGQGRQSVNTGNVVLTLLNGNRKFIVDYPGISESFPNIIYVYQQQQDHEKIST